MFHMLQTPITFNEKSISWLKNEQSTVHQHIQDVTIIKYDQYIYHPNNNYGNQ